MARFTSGALGRFKGKVDTIVGARWRGIDYIRHKGEKRTKPGTQAQLEQQANSISLNIPLATSDKQLSSAQGLDIILYEK